MRILFCFFWLANVLTGYTQPADAIAIDDIKFDARFAGLPVPRVTGKLLQASPKISVTRSLPIPL